MPVVCRFILSKDIFVIALWPHWESCILFLKNNLKIKDNIGFPTYLWEKVIASSCISPSNLFPITISNPSSNCLIKFGISLKSYVASASAIKIYFPLAILNASKYAAPYPSLSCFKSIAFSFMAISGLLSVEESETMISAFKLFFAITSFICFKQKGSACSSFLQGKIMLISGLLFVASCNNENKPATTGNIADSNTVPVPAAISYDIVNEYPHDPAAFTEGLEYKDGYLYESTGQYGSSDIRKVDLTTGKVLSSEKMEARYFGEGLTILNGKIYQLTYREGKGFVYDLATLKQEKTFTFSAPEGWGMSNNGNALIFDDGGNVLHFVDPNTFKEIKQLTVTDEHGPVKEINELELIHGFLYANQWQTDNILKIDTSTGIVVGRADLSTLRQRVGIPAPAILIAPMYLMA